MHARKTSLSGQLSKHQVFQIFMPLSGILNGSAHFIFLQPLFRIKIDFVFEVYEKSHKWRLWKLEHAFRSTRQTALTRGGICKWGEVSFLCRFQGHKSVRLFNCNQLNNRPIKRPFQSINISKQQIIFLTAKSFIIFIFYLLISDFSSRPLNITKSFLFAISCVFDNNVGADIMPKQGLCKSKFDSAFRRKFIETFFFFFDLLWTRERPPKQTLIQSDSHKNKFYSESCVSVLDKKNR